MDKTADAPRSTVESYPPLWEWLCKHDARCVWQTKADGNRVEGWRVGRSIVVITVYPKGDGWDLSTPLSSNNIEETLRDAEQRCGIE